VIYGKLTVHDRQTDEVHVEITRKGLAHARPNYSSIIPNALKSLIIPKIMLA